MNTQPRVLKWSLIIGIVVVLNLFFNYTLSLVYKQPDYNKFCPVSQVQIEPKTQAECVSGGGQWNENNYAKAERPDVVGYCDTQFTCRQGYDTARKDYDRNVFVTLVLLGVISMIVGNFFKGNEVVSAGLSLGGVLSFIIASMRYWSSSNDLIKVIILAIALVLLFWLAMKKFRNQQ